MRVPPTRPRSRPPTRPAEPAANPGTNRGTNAARRSGRRPWCVGRRPRMVATRGRDSRGTAMDKEPRYGLHGSNRVASRDPCAGVRVAVGARNDPGRTPARGSPAPACRRAFPGRRVRPLRRPGTRHRDGAHRRPRWPGGVPPRPRQHGRCRDRGVRGSCLRGRRHRRAGSPHRLGRRAGRPHPLTHAARHIASARTAVPARDDHDRGPPSLRSVGTRATSAPGPRSGVRRHGPRSCGRSAGVPARERGRSRRRRGSAPQPGPVRHPPHSGWPCPHPERAGRSCGERRCGAGAQPSVVRGPLLDIPAEQHAGRTSRLFAS